MTAAQTPGRQTAFDSDLRKLALVVIAGAIMTILDGSNPCANTGAGR